MVLLVLVAIEDYVRYTSFVTNGNVDSPFATVGGAGHGLYKAGAKGALKGGGTGMLLEFGVRSVNNIYNDVIRGSK